MPDRRDPFPPPDDTARAEAQRLMRAATSASLAVLHPVTRTPYVTCIAIGLDRQGRLFSLVSDLSIHTGGLRIEPACGLMIGEAAGRSALASPRISLSATARFVEKAAPEGQVLSADWVALFPESSAYIDFADFHLVVFTFSGGHLNAGFAKAYTLTPSDLGLL